jgi:hypothetical protein
LAIEEFGQRYDHKIGKNSELSEVRAKWSALDEKADSYASDVWNLLIESVESDADRWEANIAKTKNILRAVKGEESI